MIRLVKKKKMKNEKQNAKEKRNIRTLQLDLSRSRAEIIINYLRITLFEGENKIETLLRYFSLVNSRAFFNHR